MNKEIDKVLRHVYERAKILIEAQTDDEKLAATMRLKDAIGAVDRADGRRKDLLW